MYKKILTFITILFFILISVGITIFVVIYTSSKSSKFTVPAGVVLDAETTNIAGNMITADIVNRHRALLKGEINKFENNFNQFLSNKKCRFVIILKSEVMPNNTLQAEHINIKCNGKNYPIDGLLIEHNKHYYGITKPIHVGQKFLINTTDASKW